MSTFDPNQPPPPPPPGGGYGSTPPPPPGGGGYGGPPPPPPGDGGYGAAPAAPSGALALWPARAGGYIVDTLIALPGSILIFIGTPKNYNFSSTMGDDVSSSSGSTGAIVPVLLLGYVVAIGIAVWNRWLKGGNTGQTIGRKVAGVKLVDEATGQPIGAAKAFVRDIAHILDIITCCIPLGFAWPLWDSKRQTFADKVCKTVVVTVPKG